MTKELTIDQIAKVYGRYLQCKVRNKPYTGFPPSERDYYAVDGTLLGINMTGTVAPITVSIQNYDASGAKWDKLTVLPIEDSKLILTPLSEITDEDAIEVAEICGFNSNQKQMGKWFVKDGLMHKADFCADKYVQLIDFLRSRSYALPYTGIDLYEAGIAIKPSEVPHA